jgi:hypothetical protein
MKTNTERDNNGRDKGTDDETRERDDVRDEGMGLSILRMPALVAALEEPMLRGELVVASSLM